MKSAREMEKLGIRILDTVRTELYLSMHFLGTALHSLNFRMNRSTLKLGTDGLSIHFNAHYLFEVYMEHPYLLDRAYMHILMHCIFRHMFYAMEFEDAQLWDLCTDIAVESVIDSMDVPVLHVTPSDAREACYQQLHEKMPFFTAQRLYRHFSQHPLSFREREKLMREFSRDDHSFWERMGNSKSNPQEQMEEIQPQMLPPLAMRARDIKKEEWERNAKRIQTELESSGKNRTKERGILERILSASNREKTDYREFLRKFSVIREESKIDVDSFDYGFYHYGMELYGNMPLIEENEYRETNKVDELVIAIDTSASCQNRLVQQFLNETAGMLLEQENFFHKVHVHIIECDEKIQKDLEIEDLEEMKHYAEEFQVRGGGGTDFRPVFQHVEELQRRGKLQSLKGLLYFTDGYGIYPQEPTSYETAFVIPDEDEEIESKVPDWALKLWMPVEIESMNVDKKESTR